MIQTNEQKSMLWGVVFVLVIALVSFLTYFQVYWFEFSSDDFYSVLPIKDVEKLSSIFRYFGEPVLFLNGETGTMEPLPYFRPLATSSLTLDFFFYGKDHPGWLHIENLLLHTLNAITFFFICRILLKEEVPALFAALLYVVFPLSVEVVSIYHYRVDLLASFFLFATLYATLRCDCKQWYWLVALLFCCAMLCKESAISLLLLIPLFRHFHYGPLRPKELLCALGAPMLLYWPLRYNALGSFLTVKSDLSFDVASSGLSVPERFPYVLEGVFQKITFFFNPFGVPPKVFLFETYSLPYALAGFALCVAVLVTALAYFREKNLFSLFAIAAGITWFPVSALLLKVPDFLSPRLFYYPSPWLILLLIQLLIVFMKRNLALVLCAVLLLLWSSASFYLKATYKNNFTINLGILSLMPERPASLWNVAIEYEKRKNYPLAIQYYYDYLNASDKDAKGVEREQAFLAHIRIADLHIRTGEPQRALYILEGAKPHFPERGEIYLFEAIAHLMLKNEAAAEVVLEEGREKVGGFQKFQELYATVRKEMLQAQERK